MAGRGAVWHGLLFLKSGEKEVAMTAKIEAIRNESNLTEWLSQEFGLPCLDLTHVEPRPDVLELVPREIAERYQIVPISRCGAVLTIACADPQNLMAQDDVRFRTGYFIEVIVGVGIPEAIERLYPEDAAIEVVQESAADGLKCFVALPTQPLHEIVNDCVKQAQHVPRRKQPASYFCGDDDSNLSFEVRAARLVKEAMKIL